MLGFKLWSEIDPGAEKELKPDFGFREWDSLNHEEKYKIWKNLEEYFFDKEIKVKYGMAGDVDERFYAFYGDYAEQEYKKKRIFHSIYGLNFRYKVKSYAKNYLEKPDLNSACLDFYNIFMKEGRNVVFELLSIYAKLILIENQNLENEEKKWEEFEKFAKDLNSLFFDFGINFELTRSGFIPRQDEKIMAEIYSPVLKVLSDTRWKEVNEILSDAFVQYRVNTRDGYSNSITNTIAAVQALLQILVNGKTGIGDIPKLIQQARVRDLIPNDTFSEKIFKDIESFLSQERQRTGIAHPKNDYATEKNARFILNIAMIFFQHCLQI